MVDSSDSVAIAWEGCDSVTACDVALFLHYLKKLGVCVSVRLRIHGHDVSESRASVFPMLLVVANAQQVREILSDTKESTMEQE